MAEGSWAHGTRPSEGHLFAHRSIPQYVYSIALIALMYITVLRYTPDMTAPKKEHEERIADVRNALADAIEKARYYDETTVLTSRGKRVAVLVGMDFYERALAALGESRVLVPKPD